MNPIKNYQYAPRDNQPVGFSRGFALAVVSLLLVVALVVGGLVFSSRNSTYAANAQLVYMAATAKAIEFEAAGHYHVPVQADLVALIGDDVNQGAVIQVVDENNDAIIDYIIYSKSGLTTKYSPGKTAAAKTSR
ncbi:hypothetical protein GH810_13105 [Acetobacterium paludosum]|uniref:Uncharacterized protein n=1 Tax=Acetobacterium paludosum TaxID=52693 RepID=A0A923HVD9_9FIRM|nr:hypothetical protein [Acetobacterium paludosum]MBC3889253.1 hypothetical protein [Acetobacterium paludosum]